MNQANNSKGPYLISLLVHTIVLASLPLLNSIAPRTLPPDTIEVTYLKLAQKKAAKNSAGISQGFQQIAQKPLPKSPLPKKELFNQQRFKFDLSELVVPKETIAIPKPHINPPTPRKQKILLRDLPEEASKDPAYLSYQDKLRQKIKAAAEYYSDQFFFFDNPRNGSVFVTFVVKSDGSLSHVQIQDSKSSQDELLKKITLAAIRNSAPFEHFPTDLNYADRTFSLEISFELEKE